uniref:Uncharacterized protein n=1 Tax=Romanomermis culicivorax TaxID=13658 RepID=A0A915L8I0_ROMCU
MKTLNANCIFRNIYKRKRFIIFTLNKYSKNESKPAPRPLSTPTHSPFVEPNFRKPGRLKVEKEHRILEEGYRRPTFENLNGIIAIKTDKFHNIFNSTNEFGTILHNDQSLRGCKMSF